MCYKIPEKRNELGLEYIKNTCRTCGIFCKSLIKGKCKESCGRFYSNPLICPCTKGDRCLKAKLGLCCNQTWHDLSPELKLECSKDSKIFNKSKTLEID